MCDHTWPTQRPKDPGLATSACSLQRRASPLHVQNSEFGTPKIYTTTGFGPRNNLEMAGVDDLVVYMQTAVKIQHFLYTPPRGREAPPRWCIYKLLNFTAVCIYTTKSSTPAMSRNFLSPNPVVVYIFGVPIHHSTDQAGMHRLAPKSRRVAQTNNSEPNI